MGLACVSASTGRIDEAISLHRHALQLRHQIGDRLGVVDSLVGMAATAARAEPETAARLLGAATALRAAAGAVPTAREATEAAAALALVTDALGADRVVAARAAGATLDEDGAVATSEQISTRLLGPFPQADHPADLTVQMEG